MSFSKTVSVFAALASIFAAAATGYKLAKDNQSTPSLEDKVQQLEKQLEETKQTQVVPQPVSLPTTTSQASPAIPPLPPPVNQETQQ